ncbi:MAG: aminodeoxychorismate/anthranilate synthase component II [Bacteroidota bacterium]
MKILVLDNYDSFVYNLVQYLEEETGGEVDVYRNDQISLDQVDQYDMILLSPGPGVPSEAGIMPQIIKQYDDSKIIFGVCLGHQAIGEAYGAKIYNLAEVYHGIETDMVRTDAESVILNDVAKEFRAGRYHSWSIKPDTLPEDLIVTAYDAQGAIMAVRHKDKDVFGVQFHPESILTAEGRKMIKNLVSYVRQKLDVQTR